MEVTGDVVDENTSAEEAIIECRACLRKFNGELCVLYNMLEGWDPPWYGMESTVFQDFIKISNIQALVDDEHTKTLCQQCYIKLQDSCNFIESVKRNDLVLRQRTVAVNSDSWPKPIQLEKNLNGTIYANNMEIEIKQEVLSDTEETSVVYDQAELPKVDDIKVESEEMQPQIQITVNGTIPIEEYTSQSSTTQLYNGIKESQNGPDINKLELPVKTEPVSEDDEQTSIALTRECILCAKTFKSVSGLKAHVISQHSYKSVRRKPSNYVSPPKIEKHVCITCRRSSSYQCSFTRMYLFSIWQTKSGINADRAREVFQVLTESLPEIENIKTDNLQNRVSYICKKIGSFWKKYRSKSKFISKYSEWLNTVEHCELSTQCTCMETEDQTKPTGFTTSTDLMVHETCHNKSVCYSCSGQFDTFQQLTVHQRRCKAINSKEHLVPKTLNDVRRKQIDNKLQRDSSPESILPHFGDTDDSKIDCLTKLENGDIKTEQRINEDSASVDTTDECASAEKLKCSLCSETFTDSYYLNIHAEVKHSESAMLKVVSTEATEVESLEEGIFGN